MHLSTSPEKYSYIQCTHTHPISLPSTTQGSEWFEGKVNIEVSQASRKAIEAVERAGGRIITAHYNALGLRLLLKPWKFEDCLKPRRALPNKKLMAYYLNPENRYIVGDWTPLELHGMISNVRVR